MKIIFALFLALGTTVSLAQEYQFTRSDSLRGSLNPFRSSFDVHYYELSIEVFPEQQAIKGSNKIFFSLLKPSKTIQLDLFENMHIDSILFKQQKLNYYREGNAFFVDFPEVLSSHEMLEVFYQGTPIVAENAPWDGGFVWKKTDEGNDWIAVAVEGIGASLWWPNKDHLTDEPDSMRIICKVPENLICVSNGQFRGKTEEEGKAKYEWFVSYPINNYNVSINIADYAHISDFYITGSGDTLNLEYYVLKHNVSKAKEHFKQVSPMLRIFEELFGPYPFINDGYKLVETPYWGMEHQSAIAYGNNYINNAFGFDFIIIHESGHEYWGNSITTHDLGQMWIHEAFTTYMEALYVELMNGKNSALSYLEKQKKLIKNNMAIQQPLDVNFVHYSDADMYYKGTWMLHTIRNVIDDDDVWFKILYDLHQTYKISIVTADDIINFINERTEQDLKPIFDQYLNFKSPPQLIYHVKQKGKHVTLGYKWQADAVGFNMPLKLLVKDESYMLNVKKEWEELVIENSKVEDISLPTLYYYFIPFLQNP